MSTYQGVMADLPHGYADPFLVTEDLEGYAIPPVFSGAKNLGNTSEAFRADGYVPTLGVPAERIITLTPSAYIGIRPHSFGDDNIFWRVWFYPITIDAGMITEEVLHTIYIWNAFLDTSVNVTSITQDTTAGIEVTIPSVPYMIQKFGENNFTFSVLKVGPPQQNTTFEFIIGGELYTINIIGIRIIPFVYNVDYNEGLNYVVRFDTAISRNKYFKEQRRPLSISMKIDCNLSVFEEAIKAQHFKNTMKYGKGFVFGVPVYFEQIYASSALTGQITFNATNDLSKLWILNNKATYIIIIDPVNYISEVKEIDSVSSSSITLVQAVIETFDLATVLVYPCILSWIDKTNINNSTDDLVVANVGFKEFTVGG